MATNDQDLNKYISSRFIGESNKNDSGISLLKCMEAEQITVLKACLHGWIYLNNAGKFAFNHSITVTRI